MLWSGMYDGVNTFVSLMHMMLPQAGPPTSCSVKQGVFPVLFDLDWETKYRFNLACHMIWSMGWFVNIFAYIIPAIMLSASLMLVRRKSKSASNSEPVSPQVKVVPAQTPRSAGGRVGEARGTADSADARQVARLPPKVTLHQLLREQRELQQRLLEIQAEMQRQQGRIIELVSSADTN